MSKPSPLKVFITYSHENRAEKDELKISLSLMEQNREIQVWHDNEMLAGDKWSEKISESLAKSDILLYLVSRYSLDSENCNKELAEALQKDKKVIPIILENCDWTEHQLSDFEVLPNKGQAINKWTPESDGWQNVVVGIRRTVKEMQKAKTEPPPNEQKREKVVTLLFQQANFLQMIGQFDQAIKAYSGAIATSPDDAAAYNNRGIVRGYTGDYEGAIEDFNRAITLKPDYPNAYNNRGNVYRRTGDYGGAIADFNRAIILKPDYPEAYNNRGSAYSGKGDYDQAIVDYTRAIALKPGLTEAYYNRGLVYLSLQQWESAKKDLQDAKDGGVDIGAPFRESFGDVEVFEMKTGIKLPPDIKALLTKP